MGQESTAMRDADLTPVFATSVNQNRNWQSRLFLELCVLVLMIDLTAAGEGY